MVLRHSSDAINAMADQCRSACRSAETGADRLRELLGTCADALVETADDRRAALAEAGERIEAIARMIEAEPGIWPEDVDRCAELAEHIRSEARRLASA